MTENYILMHNNDIVADLKLNEGTGYFIKINSVIDSDKLPIQINTAKPETLSESFRSWWSERQIPTFRQNFDKAEAILGNKPPELIALLGYGQNLNDHYWMKPADSELEWEDINFYQNPQKPEFGQVLFGSRPEHINYHSPDVTTDGFLQKRWELFNGEYYLLKDTTVHKQEPFNEAVVSKFMEELDIPHVYYSTMWVNGNPFSRCPNMTTENEEFVFANQIFCSKKKPNNKNSYQHLLDCCAEQGLNVNNCINSLNQMLTIDFLILNEDRHFHNFGFIRDANSLVFKGPAPIFDNGNSFYYTQSDNEIVAGTAIQSKPFIESQKPTTTMQIKFVSDFSWLDRNALKTLPDIMNTVGNSFIEHGAFSKERLGKLVDTANNRMKALDIYINQISHERLYTAKKEKHTLER